MKTRYVVWFPEAGRYKGIGGNYTSNKFVKTLDAAKLFTSIGHAKACAARWREEPFQIIEVSLTLGPVVAS